MRNILPPFSSLHLRSLGRLALLLACWRSASARLGPRTARIGVGAHRWIDLRQPTSGALPQTMPEWIEALEFTATKFADRPPALGMNPTATGDNPASDVETANRFSVYRIRIHRPDNTPGDLQVRLLFDDSTAGARPTVSAWDELGNARWRSTGPLGDGLGLASSQTLLVPMRGVDYLEISTPGNGTGLRGAFLAWLEQRTVQVPVDFPGAAGAEASGREPFRNGALSASSAESDEHRFGVVNASLQSTPIRLGGTLPPQSGGGPIARAAQINFDLERPPLVALVRFEVLNATAGAAPKLTVNRTALGRAELALPDLADPGFRGEARAGTENLAFRYTGWVAGHKLVPGSALTAGMNTLLLELSNDAEPVAVRAVQIQLKYQWEKFDYTLQTPSP